MKIDQVLIKPVLTEKAINLAKEQTYTFNVNKKIKKSQLIGVIEKFYKVKVAKIRINIRKGKIKKLGRRMIEKKLPDKKLVFIKLKEGKIDIFPQT